MPTLKASRFELSPERYRQVQSNPQSLRMPAGNAPQHPVVVRRSPVMISSLPSISTDVDGVSRQFYDGPNIPTRRLILP